MKLYITTFILALFISAVSNAQEKGTVLKSIHDDGKTMQLKIKVNQGDVNINFDKKYDVSEMTRDEVNKLVDDVIAGLGVSKYFKPTHSEENKSSEKDLVAAAVKDYVEALYQADTTMIERSVAKHLAKRGYYTNQGVVQDATMTYDQLVRLTKRWKSSQEINESTPRKIVVFDVLDKIASAKLEAKWGIDYFHLSKENGKWMIVNVLWQEYPKSN